jgi:hypothetical protein
VPLSCTSSPLSVSLIYRLVLLVVSQSLACSNHTLFFLYLFLNIVVHHLVFKP